MVGLHILRCMPGSRSACRPLPLATTVLLGAAFLNPLSDFAHRPAHEVPDLPGAGQPPAVRKPIVMSPRALQKLSHLVHADKLARIGHWRFSVACRFGVGDGCRWELRQFDLELWPCWLGRPQSSALIPGDEKLHHCLRDSLGGVDLSIRCSLHGLCSVLVCSPRPIWNHRNPGYDTRMADVFDSHLRIMRDGGIWYSVGPSGDHHRIGCWERLCVDAARKRA